MKKQVIIGIAAVCLAASASVSALALGVHSNSKASNDDSPIVPANGQAVSVQDVQKEEIINDRSLTQENIFNKMLNTVDYYQSVYGSFEINNAVSGHQTVTYQAGMKEDMSYQKVSGSGTDQEQYYQGGEMTRYDNQARTYRSVAVAPFLEEPQMRSSIRVTENEDGTKNYFYRGDATHTGIAASMSLLPQELTFGFLEDFALWEIKGTETFLNRDVVRIEGTTEKEYGEKLDVARFVFLVDLDTGILLKYDGYSSEGKVTDYMHTQEIAIDQGITMNFNARDAKYAGYQDVSR